jgi:hypothetical protein
VWNAWRGRRWEAAWAQLDAGPCSPRCNPGRRRPRCRSAAPGGHKVAGFAVLRAPGRVPRARAATDLVLASWPAAWMTLMARAREARASRSGPWLRCGSARQTVQHHATTRCRGQPQPCRSEGIHVVAARPGVFVHFSHVMNTTAPAATPGRRPFSAGAPGIAHGPRHPAERAHTAPVAERGVERPGCARPCPRVPARDPVRRACVERPDPAPCVTPCARGATAEAKVANFGQIVHRYGPGGHMVCHARTWYKVDSEHNSTGTEWRNAATPAHA